MLREVWNRPAIPAGPGCAGKPQPRSAFAMVGGGRKVRMLGEKTDRTNTNFFIGNPQLGMILAIKQTKPMKTNVL
jgi:hypothetical protein